MRETPDMELQYLKGIGPKRLRLLNQMGINSVS